MTGAETVNGVEVQAERGLAGQRVHAEQDGLADAQRVDGGAACGRR